MNILAHQFTLLLVVLAVLSWLLTYLPVVRKTQSAIFYRKEVLPPLMFLLIGAMLLFRGMDQEKTGEIRTYKRTGPVFGWQNIIVGGVLILSSVFLAVHNRKAKR